VGAVSGTPGRSHSARVAQLWCAQKISQHHIQHVSEIRHEPTAGIAVSCVDTIAKLTTLLATLVTATDFDAD